MASTKKPSAPAKKTTPPNKPAPASPGSSAEETGSGAAPAAPASNSLVTETGSSPASESQGTPPAGGEAGVDQENNSEGDTGNAESGAGSQNDDKTDKGNGIRAKTYVVSAKVEGFRRAGRAWSKVETPVLAADLTDEQIEALLGEPMLDVVLVC